MHALLANVVFFVVSSSRAEAAYSPISRAELGAMVAEIAPVVAEVAGRAFQVLPEVVLADENDLAAVLLRERLHLMAEVGGADPEALAAFARAAAARQPAPGFEGKYGFVDDRLYVSVDRVMSTLARHHSPEHMLRPMVQVILAHELAHALQDQHTPMDALLRAARSDDAVMAMNCAFEGHAVWVHEGVAARLGLGEAAGVMVEMMGYEAPITGEMSPDLFYSRYVYGMGRDFVAWHASHGGIEQVWRVLRAPPSTTAEIASPARYAEVDRPDALEDPVGSSLDRLARRLGDPTWTLRHSTVGDYDVRDQLVRAGADVSMADGLDRGWSLSSVGGDDRGLQVQALRFNSPGHAQRYTRQLRNTAVAQAEALRRIPFLQADVGPFERVANDLAARSTLTRCLGDGPSDTQARLWVARGAHVVQLVTVNTALTDRQVAAALRRVFRALDHPAR